MELRHLQYFLALAEELNFSRAADRLHIAQPSLSQQIRQLERELDADLFDRSVRPIQLTSAGELLKTDAYGLVADLEATAREVRRAGRGEVGRLRIGYSYGGSYDLVLSLLRRLRKTWPDANVFVHQLPQQEQVPALIAGRVDLVLGRLIEVLPSDIVVQALRDEHLIAILPLGHPQAAGPTADLGALGEEPFVMFPRRMEPIVFDNYAQACLGAGFTLHVEHEVTDAQTQALAIAAGLGVGLSGDHLALRFPELAYVPVAPEFVIARIVALWVDRRVPPALKEFMASF